MHNFVSRLFFHKTNIKQVFHVVWCLFFIIFLFCTGGPLGTVIVMPIAGFFSDSAVGWPGVFYLLGGVGFTWTAIFLFCGLDSPNDHKSISPEELRYIQDGVDKTKKTKQDVCIHSLFNLLKKNKDYHKCIKFKIIRPH